MGTISDRFIQEQTRSSYKKGSDRSGAERDSSIEEGNLKSTNIADFENEAVASLVTQFKSMAASIGKEEQSSVAQIYCILKEAFQRTSSIELFDDRYRFHPVQHTPKLLRCTWLSEQ